MKLKDTPIVVIGEALVDILPDGTERPGGSPANVALALGRLGFSPSLVTVLADDQQGREVREWLEESGVRVSAHEPATGRTSTARVTLDAAGVASYAFDLCWDLPTTMAVSAVAGAELVHVGSIATVLKPGADAVAAAMRAARVAGALVTFDPNARPSITPDVGVVRAQVEALVALADVVKVSDEDLAWYYPGVEPMVIARKWLGLGPRIVVVTLGGAGAIGVERQADGKVREIAVPGVPITVVDTVGAGDTFMGALIAALLDSNESQTLANAMEFAATAAAITCSRAGANPPTAAELGAPR
ncbi:MAG: carbohydrate kinase [Promicromonosporaceae bacterium]|nr:carbohydrate kinase [Promicromonosporaceae bacterium]